MLEVEGLSYTYKGRSEATLQTLEFAVEAGEIFGFLGPSGAGKSTTQKILIGLLRGYEGQARVCGREIRAWNEDLYEEIGVAFEVPRLFLKLTGRENLRYFGSLYSRPCRGVDELLEAVGLLEDAETLVSQYSKGMRSRLNVARALLHKPRLLFLDEPTSGLDPSNAQKIKELLRKEKEAGTTLFLTTHAMNLADDLCDRVAFLIQGHVHALAPPRELKLKYGQKSLRVEYREGESLESRDFGLEGLAEDRAFLELLRHPGLQTIHTQETTLEKIFLQITGQALQV